MDIEKSGDRTNKRTISRPKALKSAMQISQFTSQFGLSIYKALPFDSNKSFSEQKTKEAITLLQQAQRLEYQVQNLFKRLSPREQDTEEMLQHQIESVIQTNYDLNPKNEHRELAYSDDSESITTYKASSPDFKTIGMKSKALSEQLARRLSKTMTKSQYYPCVGKIKKVFKISNHQQKEYLQYLKAQTRVYKGAGRKIADPEVENLLVNIGIALQRVGRPLSRPEIRMLGGFYKKDLNGDESINEVGRLPRDIKLSKGWLDKFIRRNPQLEVLNYNSGVVKDMQLIKSLKRLGRVKEARWFQLLLKTRRSNRGNKRLVSSTRHALYKKKEKHLDCASDCAQDTSFEESIYESINYEDEEEGEGDESESKCISEEESLQEYNSYTSTKRKNPKTTKNQSKGINLWDYAFIEPIYKRTRAQRGAKKQKSVCYREEMSEDQSSEDNGSEVSIKIQKKRKFEHSPVKIQTISSSNEKAKFPVQKVQQQGVNLPLGRYNKNLFENDEDKVKIDVMKGEEEEEKEEELSIYVSDLSENGEMNEIEENQEIQPQKTISQNQKPCIFDLNMQVAGFLEQPSVKEENKYDVCQFCKCKKRQFSSFDEEDFYLDPHESHHYGDHLNMKFDVDKYFQF